MKPFFLRLLKIKKIQETKKQCSLVSHLGTKTDLKKQIHQSEREMQAILKRIHHHRKMGAIQEQNNDYAYLKEFEMHTRALWEAFAICGKECDDVSRDLLSIFSEIKMIEKIIERKYNDLQSQARLQEDSFLDETIANSFRIKKKVSFH